MCSKFNGLTGSELMEAESSMFRQRNLHCRWLSQSIKLWDLLDWQTEKKCMPNTTKV